MSQFCSVTLIGTVTKEASLKTVGAKGTKLCEWEVSTTSGFGQYQSYSTYKVIMWGERGAAMMPSIRIGEMIAVTGMLENKAYNTQMGERRDSWTVTAQEVTPLTQNPIPSYTQTYTISKNEDSSKEDIVW